MSVTSKFKLLFMSSGAVSMISPSKSIVSPASAFITACCKDISSHAVYVAACVIKECINVEKNVIVNSERVNIKIGFLFIFFNLFSPMDFKNK